MSYETDGQLIIDATCVSANITARGNMSITDNGTTTNLTQDAVYNSANVGAAIWTYVTRTLTTGVTLTNAGIDAILTRAISNAEGSAASRCLLWAIAKLTNKVDISGTTLTVRKTNDTDSQFTQTVASDASAEPIISVDTN